MTNIKVENWLGNEIRFVEINNEWLAVAGDITKALDVKNTSDALKRIEEQDKDIVSIYTLGGTQEVLAISEFAVYEIIFTSRKKEATQFKRWVYEIIKTLRIQADLEAYEMFKLMEKDTQKTIMDKLKSIEPSKQDYIKAHQITNKAVSNKFGFKKLVKKGDMTPEMLVERNPILNDTVELMIAKEKFELDVDVKAVIYSRHS